MTMRMQRSILNIQRKVKTLMYNDIEKIFAQGKGENGCTRGKRQGIGVFAEPEGEQYIGMSSCGEDNNTSEDRKTWGVKGYPLSSVYAPIQCFEKLYDPDTSLKRGTVFEELDLPFEGESVYKGGNWRG